MRKKEINGLNRYIVYADGRIFSKARKIFLKPYCNHKGYFRVSLVNNKNKTVKYSVHRLVAMSFIENKHNNPLVCHKDSNVKNNNCRNLYWGSSSDNMRDRKKSGNYHDQKGENNYYAKLTNKDVKKIKTFFKDGMSPYKLHKTRIFKISYGTLCDIKSGKTWKHVQC